MNDNVIKRNNAHITDSGTKIIVFAHSFGCDQNKRNGYYKGILVQIQTGINMKSSY